LQTFISDGERGKKIWDKIRKNIYNLLSVTTRRTCSLKVVIPRVHILKITHNRSRLNCPFDRGHINQVKAIFYGISDGWRIYSPTFRFSILGL